MSLTSADQQQLLAVVAQQQQQQQQQLLLQQQQAAAAAAAAVVMQPPQVFPQQQQQQQQQQTTSSTPPLASTSSGLCDEKTVEYLRDLIAERQSITDNGGEGNSSSNSSGKNKNIVLKLLDQEIARIQGGGKPPGRESKFVDVYHEKPIRLSVRAVVPVKEHPKFNFVGKLLGPKGNSMKRLQEETMTKMAVLGRGSMRSRQQEEDLRQSSDPKYAHLSEDLHVEITAFAPPSEAHARVAYALAEVRKYLIPDSNDEIRHQQMREMELINSKGNDDDEGSENGGNENESVCREDSPTQSPPPRFHNQRLTGTGGKNKVMSILDKIRGFNFPPQQHQQQHHHHHHHHRQHMRYQQRRQQRQHHPYHQQQQRQRLESPEMASSNEAVVNKDFNGFPFSEELNGDDLITKNLNGSVVNRSKLGLLPSPPPPSSTPAAATITAPSVLTTSTSPSSSTSSSGGSS